MLLAMTKDHDNTICMIKINVDACIYRVSDCFVLRYKCVSKHKQQSMKEKTTTVRLQSQTTCLYTLLVPSATKTQIINKKK